MILQFSVTRIRFLLLSLIGTLLFTGLAFAVVRYQVLPGDEQVYLTLQAQRSPALDSFFSTVTRAGSREILIPVGVAMLLWRIKDWRFLLFLVCYASGIPLLEAWTKSTIARPRPANLYSTYSFPSGHALAAAALYGLLTILLQQEIQNRKWRQGLTAGILLIILLIGVSRIYLGVHWLSDVLGGYALGGAYCSLATAVYGWIARKNLSSA